jgi:hypothetical protein
VGLVIISLNLREEEMKPVLSKTLLVNYSGTMIEQIG